MAKRKRYVNLYRGLKGIPQKRVRCIRCPGEFVSPDPKSIRVCGKCRASFEDDRAYVNSDTYVCTGNDAKLKVMFSGEDNR